MMAETATPYVNLHLDPHMNDFPGIPLETTDPVHAEMVFERFWQDTMAVVRRYGPEMVIAENVPYHASKGEYLRPGVEPDLITRLLNERQRVELPDTEYLKRTIGLSLPPLVANMRYSAKIKTEAVIRLGFYSVVKFFKRILKKPIHDKNEEEILALKDGVLRIKRETERSIVFHFKDYKENIKFQYILKLAEVVSKTLYEAIIDRFQTYVSNLSMVVERISEKRIDKE